MADRSGRFDLGELAPGRWRLSATMDGYDPSDTALAIFAGDDRPTCSVCLPSGDLELALRPTAGLWITVSHGLGPVLTHVQAAVVGAVGRQVAAGSYEVEAEGRVHLPSVPAGRWELLVGARGLATVSLPVTAPNDRPRIVLETGSGLAISVPELGDETVMAQAEVQRPDGRPFRSLSWRGVRSSFPLDFGAATIQGLSAGSWKVTVTAADERSWSATVTVLPGEIELVRLE